MILSKLKIVGGLALAGLFTLGVGAAAAQKLGGSGEAAKVEKPAEDTLDALIAKMKKQAEQSEARTKQLEGELKAVRAELEAANARSQALVLPKTGTSMRDVNKARERKAADPAMMPGMMSGPGGGGPGMMSGMMSGMMGGVGGGQAPQTLATYQSDDFVVVHKPKSDKVAAYSTETGEWTTYQVPKGTDVVPIYSAGVVALVVRGDEIDQIATFVPKAGKWYPIDLKEPGKGDATPIVNQNQAVYAIGRHVYAFSVPTRAWDVLELPEGAKPVAITFNNRATVEHGDHLYIFSVKTGKWTDFNARANQVETPEAK